MLGFSCIWRPLILGTLFSGQVHGELILPSAAILEHCLATSHSCYTKFDVRALVCCCNIIIGILFVFLAELPILFCHGTSDLQDVFHLRHIFNRPSMRRSVISLSDLSHLLRISLLPWWKFINGLFIIKENCEALVLSYNLQNLPTCIEDSLVPNKTSIHIRIKGLYCSIWRYLVG